MRSNVPAYGLVVVGAGRETRFDMTTTDLRDYLQRVRRTSGMFLFNNTFAEACAFLVGYDQALQGGLLAGFREWLVVRTDGRSKLVFPRLVLEFVAPGANDRSLTPEQDRLAKDALFDLLDEFLSLGKLENRVATAVQIANTRRMDRFHCLCCGFATMREMPPGTHQICQVCFWHDDWLDAEEFTRPIGPNSVSLQRARQNFLRFGAAEKRVLGYVRKPSDSEKPRLPLEDLAPAADRLLRTKFPKGSRVPKVNELHSHLAYWSTFVNCIVFPLIMGLPAVYSRLDVGRGQTDVRAELEAALTDSEASTRDLLQEYFAYCDLLIEVWRSTNPRWNGKEWELQPRETNSASRAAGH